MINGRPASPPPSSEQPGPATVPPSDRRPVVAFAALVVALISVGMIVMGMMDRPAEPSWANPQPPDDTERTPSASLSAPASPAAPASGSPSPSRTRVTVPAQRLSAKPDPTGTPTRKPPTRTPTTRPATTAPTTIAPATTATPRPTTTSSAPQVAQLLGDCSPSGARAQTRSGIPLVCRTRSWDPVLRWRLA